MSGLEAIGVAASIIQVADLGTKLSVQLFSFYRRYKNANESVQLLSNEIALVSAILRELGDNLKEEESSKLCSEEAFRTLRLVLTQCRDVLGQIERVVDGNDHPGKSRFQHVVVKARMVLLEPSLDQLKTNLERLKSTMLLLLNVIMYAGQIRNNNVPVLVQEQRDLLESLLDDRQADMPEQGQPDAAGSSRDLSTKTTHPGGQLAHSRTDGMARQKQTLKDYLASKNQSSGGSIKSTNSSGFRSQALRDTKRNEPPELKEYHILMQNMLHEIDSCRNKLEQTRHSRIKDGVLNIHSGEIMRFKSEYGDSIHIDHSLFAEQKLETVREREVTHPSLTPTSSRLSSRSAEVRARYFDSDESEFSESDISIHGRHGRAHGRASSHRRRPRAGERSPVVQQPSLPYVSSRQHSYERARPPTVVVSNRDIRPRAPTDETDSDGNLVKPGWRHVSGAGSRDASPYHRDYELLIDQRMLKRNDERNEMPFWRQHQEIERLERELERRHQRSVAEYDIRKSQLVRGEETLDEDEDEMSARLRRLDVVERKSRSEAELKEMAYVKSLVKKAEEEAAARREKGPEKNGDISDAFYGAEGKHFFTPDADLKNVVDTMHSTSPGPTHSGMDTTTTPAGYQSRPNTGPGGNTQDDWDALQPLGGWHTKPSRAPYQPKCSRELEGGPEKSTVVGRGGNDAQGQTLSDLSLPDNLEDLLAQWTTLDKQEIQRGQIEAY